MLALLRAACRRDPVLAFGYGLNSLMAGVNVWCAGNRDQQRLVADVLLGGGRVACAYHELPHGNDLSRMEFTASPHSGGWRLRGRKEVITNIARSEAMVLFARTDPRPGSRSHSQFLLHRSELATGSVRDVPRFPLAGLRGVQFGGLEFFDSPVPAESVVGRPGQGLETAMRSFQVTRVTIPAMAIGTLDLALRVSVRYARGRHLYGARVADLALVRSELATTFVDLLVADCLAGVGARILHLRPQEGSPFAAAVKYLVPHLLIAGANRLSSVLGSQFYLRRGEHALLQKIVRDLQPTAFVHASAANCQLTLLPQLPLLARRGWRTDADPDPHLFRLGADLPPLDVAALSVTSTGTDSVLGVLLSGRRRDGGRTDDDRVRQLVEVLAREAETLVERCRELEPRQPSVTAEPAVYRLAHRYAVLLAAACCLEVRANHEGPGDAPGDLGDWFLPAALTRLVGLLGRGDGALDDELADTVVVELDRRYDAGRTFDLAAARLPSTRRPDDVGEPRA